MGCATAGFDCPPGGTGSQVRRNLSRYLGVLVPNAPQREARPASGLPDGTRTVVRERELCLGGGRRRRIASDRQVLINALSLVFDASASVSDTDFGHGIPGNLILLGRRHTRSGVHIG